MNENNSFLSKMAFVYIGDLHQNCLDNPHGSRKIFANEDKLGRPKIQEKIMKLN